MSTGFTIECDVDFGRVAHGRKLFQNRTEKEPVPSGRIPRVSRLLALAIRLENLVRSGSVKNYRELSDLGHITPARMSQIMNLLCLAVDIQEEILFLPRIERRRDRVTLGHMQEIALEADWAKQRRKWQRLRPD